MAAIIAATVTSNSMRLKRHLLYSLAPPVGLLTILTMVPNSETIKRSEGVLHCLYSPSCRQGGFPETPDRPGPLGIGPVLVVGRDLPIRTGALRVSANCSRKLSGANGI